MTPPKPLKTLDVRTLAAWRRWLAAHHRSESEVWVIFHKLHTGRSSIAYSDALDEALCFGWIDSLVKRLDEDRFARKFTPRRPDSKWSAINRKKYAALQASGRLQPAGLERPPTGRSYAPPPPRRTSDEVPVYIRDGIKKHRAAWSFFEQLAPFHRRRFVNWIDTAKQEETKMRRLREAIERLAAGQQLDLK